MRERIRPTRSGLFTIELLMAVGVFSLCAAICMGLFVRAEVMSRNSSDLNRAVTEARSVVECFKAAGGDIERTALLTGGSVMAGTLYLEYDENWNRLGPWLMGTFKLTLRPVSEEGYIDGSLSVKRYDDRDGADPEEEILGWDVAALEVTP